ncbi:uncharacterized protein STEHIDRAFT_169568 [Stereum hirsutum FP-91666 SS1]|uniref:uncharacterized protein n=1 Tax=Stereum hirsutum (strain FP-91666) TaxID=721885 RepID=UPI000444A813|nr:uncharacterized protein STEHIDRAFT_169568 [Stereum hirsutum FP-91666 SS1]EIM85716.1 hypothetical protein STEHIDRAFT_169568 [Stereum hirsutum FP-91666 SS1]
MALTLESLPVELIAGIMEQLDLESLITLSYLSHRLHHIASDFSLNPWRRPLLSNLLSGKYENCLKHLSVRSIVPRQNWVEILSMARSSFLLFDATLPNMKEVEWEECFKRRFLPGWQKWKRDGSWKEAYKKVLFRAWHRSETSCTTDEAWTKYIVLNRNGSANELEASSRSFNPLAIFNDMKLQSNLAHLETHIRLVVQFADVRILAFGVLNNPRGKYSVNPNARRFLHPPGIEGSLDAEGAALPQTPQTARSSLDSQLSEARSTRSSSTSNDAAAPSMSYKAPPPTYEHLSYPLPSQSHANYPLYTPGGQDKRWLGAGSLEEGGRQWVGGLMLIAQITGPHTNKPWTDGPIFQDLDLVVGQGRSQYASFTWDDLVAIAPWMEEHITKKVDGPGLGH